MIAYEGHKVYMNGECPAIYLNGKNQHIHRLQWEKYHGKIPKGFIVHHKDENKLNWNIDNLELLSRSQHIKKHKNVVHRKGFIVIAIKGEIKLTFDSIKKAAKYCGTYDTSIHRIFKGEQHTANGWTFKRR